jgi:ubiquinone/menaquinone biosynthesis C-methylase UbiE
MSCGSPPQRCARRMVRSRHEAAVSTTSACQELPCPVGIGDYPSPESIVLQDLPVFRATWAEPLDQLARFALDRADDLCAPHLGCCAYHKAWTMLRLHEAAGALPYGIDFIRQELAACAAAAGGRPLRVMLSGAADTGQAALVLSALAAVGIAAELVVVDICRTPLGQHALFLEGTGQPFTLIHGDAVTVETAPVDIILAHSFLSFVAPERREALVANWARLLSPVGRILVLERFSPTPGIQPAWPDPNEREARRSTLHSALTAAALPPAEVERRIGAADGIWALTGKRFRMSDDQFRAAITRAGLTLVRLDLVHNEYNVSPIQSKAVARERPRTLAVAVKP